MLCLRMWKEISWDFIRLNKNKLNIRIKATLFINEVAFHLTGLSDPVMIPCMEVKFILTAGMVAG